ncbi:MAG: VCBS repeat-containing protein [Acidobacteriaceae bacterium]|nr:VCBS repeat-containing protein [Acidobacteriaceae bacterium]MBV9502176.1 VCBS repeat-containing protein [Acidobacteriaceae bacterium]
MHTIRPPVCVRASRPHRFFLTSPLLSLALLAFLPSALDAQAPTLLLGNSQIPAPTLAQGYTVQPNVSQTASTTTLAYTVTSPPGNLAPVMVSKVLYEAAIPGSATTNITINVSWTGSLYVTQDGNAIPHFTAGYVDSNSPNPQTINTTIQGGLGSFVFTCASLTSETSTITVTINVGNPLGGRKPYINDFDGFGYTDFTVWRPSNGTWYLHSRTPYTSQISWGLNGDVPVPGDYDGDGIADLAVWRPSEGNWYVTLSSTGGQFRVPWGQQGDIPIAGGDYDGDGKTDFAIWRPSTGTWWVILSSTGAVVRTSWGIPGDIPLVGNFDGDAKTDYVIYRPSEGNWYILPSSTGVGRVVSWGAAGDIPVPGDYDRDGITDYAVWRPSEGKWYVFFSVSGSTEVALWGLPGDIPVPGDYNSDGITDFAIWRPSEGNWYVLGSGGQGPNPPVLWGLANDVPIGRILTTAP